MFVGYLTQQHATQRHALVGFGKENKATYAYLLWLWVSPQQCTIFDKRKSLDEIPPWVFSSLGPKYLQGQDFSHYDVVWFTPWLTKHLALWDWVVWTDRLSEIVRTHVDEFCSLYSGKIIAVTWSKGKSTTASMISHVLSQAWISVCLAWNVWLPLLEQFTLYRDVDVFVLELSSYMLEASRWFRCDIGILTTLTQVHIREHWDYPTYIDAKLRVVEHAMQYAFIGTQALGELHHQWYSTELERLSFEEYWYWWSYAWHDGSFVLHNIPFAQSVEMNVLWDHNKYNAAICFALWEIFSLSTDFVVKGLETFTWLDHRLQLVRDTWVHRWYDDAIATTPLATLAAINTFGREVWCVLLGGIEGEYDFSELVSRLVMLSVPCIVLFPDTGQRIHTLLLDLWYTWLVYTTQSMADAVQWAARHTPPHHVVLLSCGSPSFSLWNNYIEKWQQFIDAVHLL
jgi:UDP-N-acetylmuramoylalanine--D-glutamate ligase